MSRPSWCLSEPNLFRCAPFLFLAALTACGEEDPQSRFERVRSCSATPSVFRAPLSDQPLAIPFSVSAVIGREDGSQEEDVTAACAWSTSDPTIVEYDAARGVFVLRGAGSVSVTASYAPAGAAAESRIGDCDVTMRLYVDPPVAAAPTLEIDPPSAMIPVGGSVQLTAHRIQGDQSQEVTSQVRWSIPASGSLPLATVSNIPGSKGMVTGIAPGTTRVEITLNELSASAVLKVTEQPIERLEFERDPIDVREGSEASVRLYAYQGGTRTVVPSPPCRAISGSPMNFTVTMDGDRCRVRGVAKGQGQIEASVGGLTATAQINVLEFRPTSLAVTPIRLNGAVGERFQLRCEATFTDGSKADITSDPMTAWSSSNLATTGPVRSGAGRFLGEGTADIECARHGLTAKAQATVTPAAVRSCEVTPRSSTLRSGETQPLTLFCSYTDGQRLDRTQTGTWRSRDDAVATVSNQSPNKGVVTGRSTATQSTTIEANFETFTATAAVTVTPVPPARVECEPGSFTMGVSSQFSIAPQLVMPDGSRAAPAVGSIRYSVTGTVVMVSGGGLVRGMNPGRATITCTHSPSGLTDDVNVYVLRRCDRPVIDGSFSGSIGLWSVSGGLWEVGGPTSGPGSCFSSPYCAGTNLSGDSSCQTATIWSQRFRLCELSSSESTIQIRWREWFDFGNHRDGRITVQEWNPSSGQYTNLIQNRWVAGGSSPRWTQNANVDLSTYAGRSIRIGFTHLVTNVRVCPNPYGYQRASGWYLDDIEVVAY